MCLFVCFYLFIYIYNLFYFNFIFCSFYEWHIQCFLRFRPTFYCSILSYRYSIQFWAAFASGACICYIKHYLDSQLTRVWMRAVSFQTCSDGRGFQTKHPLAVFPSLSLLWKMTSGQTTVSVDGDRSHTLPLLLCVCLSHTALSLSGWDRKDT